MQDILRSNDLVLMSFAESILADAGIGAQVADQHISGMEGFIGAFPRRLRVLNDDVPGARRALTDAGLAEHLLSDDQ